jgi:hypothetical protein
VIVVDRWETAPVHSLPSAHVSITAWVEESGSHHERDPHTYILAAALCVTNEADDVRERLRGLRQPGQRKLHWRDEDGRRRQHITASISQLSPLEHVVVVRSTEGLDRLERRRRKAMEVLLFQLTSLDVEHVTVESRGRADDRRDRRLLESMRRRRHLLGPIRMDHTPGPADPMLWVPDAVCGAVTEMRCGDDSYFRQMKSRVEIIDV